MLDHKLIVFYHLAKNPNTTKVAEELRLSQPAISKNVKELERELGITLFDRNKGRLVLSHAGVFLLEKTEEMVNQERDVLFTIDRMKESFCSTLHVGASTTLSQYILPKLLAHFNSQFPDIDITLESGNSDRIEEEVLNGSLHTAFIEGRPIQPDIRYIPFIRDEIVLVCAADNSIEESITPNRLKDFRFVLREKGSGTYHVIKKHLTDAGIDVAELDVQLILGTTEGIKQYLLHSNCFALLSVYSVREELAAGKLKVVEIEGLSIDRMFYAIHRQGEPDAYARHFLDFILTHAR